MLLVSACIFVTLGAAILIAALLPVRRLIAQLPEGPVRRRWYLLATLIKLFILGYLGYFAILVQHDLELHDLIAPVVFLLGACFVWLTTALSLQTAGTIRRVSQLEQETMIDPLTGIFNRRCLERRMREEFDRFLRYNTPFSILLIDVDHFKKINDTYGHQTGDQVLCSLAKQLQHSLRTSDIVARYGGEEFLVLAPGTELEVGRGLAERLRQYTANHGLVLGNGAPQKLALHLTVSIGVADSRGGCLNHGDMIRRADQALYRAKIQGRNRVELGVPESPDNEQLQSCIHA